MIINMPCLCLQSSTTITTILQSFVVNERLLTFIIKMMLFDEVMDYGNFLVREWEYLSGMGREWE